VLRTTLKGVLGHKARLAATMLAVLLGVGFLAGTLVLTDTITQSYDDASDDAYADADVVVRRDAAFSSAAGGTDQRGRVDASLVETVASADGVAAAEGRITGYARLVGRDGEPLGNPDGGAATLGGNWADADALNPFTLAEGTGPQAEDEVVVDRGSAQDGGYTVGDTVTVLAQGPAQSVRIVGIATYGGEDSAAGSSWVLFSTEAAQRLVGQPGEFDAVVALAEDGTSASEATANVVSALPAGHEALTGADAVAETKSDARSQLAFFNTFMTIFAVIALLVGTFIIYNTFSITVAQRTRENALIRAIGGTRRQIVRSVLVEAVIVGALASLVGVVVGVGVASGLKAMLSAFGFDLPPGSVVLSPRTVVISLVVGIATTVVAAVVPARKAGKVAPVAALREVSVGSTGYGSRLRVVVGGALLALGAASLLAGLFGGGDNAMPLIAAGALAVFFGVSALGRTIAMPLSRLLGAPLPRLRGIAGTLGRENAMRNPKRTAATASALMIGVGLISFIAILAASTRTSIDGALDRSVAGDLVVTPSSRYSGGLDPGLAGRIADLPEVDAVAGLRSSEAAVDGSATPITGLDAAAASALVDVAPVEGSLADLDVDGIGVFEDVATDEGLAVGDTVPVVFRQTGAVDLTVAVIYGEEQLVGEYLLGLPAYEANVAEQFDAEVFVGTAEGVDAEAALAAVEGVAATYPGSEVLDPAGFKAEQTQEVDQLLGVIYALLGLAVLIALLGITNTLVLSILERTRELGLLRAVGMSRGQLRSTVRWEAVIIALQGTLLGIVIGLFFGWALVTALNDQGVDELTFPVPTLAVIVVLAALAGVAAAVVPARRAAKLDVLRAVVTD
jgi:putative ABC transport system permease protein